ncbi:hypothetical protein Taro_001250 [Colocasia esculenta]|uniref:Uncharacterized protein n=1 Tax=Colocasia esculenta TaxID=4460 RepID=A0A843TE69_COLES|nr:hypothetical protein [Colocasia esculenta]
MYQQLSAPFCSQFSKFPAAFALQAPSPRDARLHRKFITVRADAGSSPGGGLGTPTVQVSGEGGGDEQGRRGGPAGEGSNPSTSSATSSASAAATAAIDKDIKKVVQKTAATFAPRASTASKNPAVPGTALYTVFEVQGYVSMLLGGALSFNLVFPSDQPDIWRLMGMWSIWMFSQAHLTGPQRGYLGPSGIRSTLLNLSGADRPPAGSGSEPSAAKLALTVANQPRWTCGVDWTLAGPFQLRWVAVGLKPPLWPLFYPGGSHRGCTAIFGHLGYQHGVQKLTQVVNLESGNFYKYAPRAEELGAIPSLRARDCSKNEKEALNYLFLLIPLLNIIIPFFWKSFAVVWSADTIAFFIMYAWKLGWLQNAD